ncbi:MAG TPA: hypothetical protein VF187_09685 [Gemmatimonadales bacterium]
MKSGRVAPVAAALVLLAAPLAAQNRRCQLEVQNVDREGVSTSILGTSTTNYFAGGNVRLKCRGQNVRIWADSIASYGGTLVQFIGSFRYEDESARVSSDFGTYYREAERWEARGNVHYRGVRDDSELRGPMADYLRPLRGVRELAELFADQRPTLKLSAQDSAGRASEPYTVVGDRIRMRGEELMWAGGSVTIDRTDLRGRSDSLQLDSGKGSAGALIGRASIRREGADSFALAGKRIDLALEKKELSGVTGRDSATLTSENLDLTAATIHLRLQARKVIQTLAWGTSPRPSALADDYEVRGDSLAVDTPAEQIRELRSFRRAWVGFRPDSAKGERDWLAGDAIVASFDEVTGSKGKKSMLRRLQSEQSASAFYRVNKAGAPGGRPSINYSRADRIVLTLSGTDSLKVEKVEMTGKVDGVQLEPEARRVDTTRVRPGVRPPGPGRPDER